MKTIIVLFFLLVTLSTKADTNLGKTISLSLTPASGDYQLGVQFAYDSSLTGDKFNLLWGILFVSTVSDQELSTLPAQLKWNIFDGKAQKYLDSWANRPMIARETLKVAALEVAGDVAKLAIGNQGSIYVVFADQNGNPFYNLNVGALCKSHPAYFINVTNTAKRCDQVTVKEIEDAQKLFCSDEAKELLKLLKGGLITCDEAKSSYSQKGCGEFTCK